MTRLRLLLLLPFFVLMAPAASQAGDQNGARQFVEDMAQRVVNVLENKASDLAQKDAELKQIFEGNIAIDWVGRFVLGRHWRTASEPQKQAYLASYKAFIINSYVNRLKEYSGEKFNILQGRDIGEGQYMLNTEILRPGNQPNVLVDYKIRDEDGRYMIYDIVVEGVSLISTQRSEFDSVVSRKGLDFLIEQLAAKAQANAGT
jgi:phospholipid transport system substrate-binding protein